MYKAPTVPSSMVLLFLFGTKEFSTPATLAVQLAPVMKTDNVSRTFAYVGFGIIVALVLLTHGAVNAFAFGTSVTIQRQ